MLLSIGSLFLLLVAELVLRGFGWGGYPEPVMRVGELEEGTLYTTSNSGASTYFYTGSGKPGTMYEDVLLMPKPSGTKRIVIAGASAALGFPYPYASGLGQHLRVILSQALGVHCEVLNVATTAIASYPAVSLGIAMLDYEPDAVVLYAGNNEFFGAYGWASAHPLFTGRYPGLQRWVNGLALLQSLRSLVPDKSKGSGKLLIEGMMDKSYIAPGSPMRRKAAAAYRRQLRRLIKETERRGIPLVICTLPANERDMAPYGEPELGKGVPLQSDALTTDEARHILSHSPRHSLAHYVLGQALLSQGKEKEAQEHLRLALDYDTLPWRAPNCLSDIVREEAPVVCDLQAAFRSHSPHGLVGWELMIDHVHPNAQGQILAAHEIASKLLPLLSAPEGAQKKADEAANRLVSAGLPLPEAYSIAVQISNFLKVSIFSRYNPKATDIFRSQAEQMAEHIPEELRKRILEAITQQSLNLRNEPASAHAAAYYFAQGDYDKALPLLAYIQGCAHPTSDSARRYALTMLQCTRAPDSDPLPEQVNFVKEQLSLATWRARHDRNSAQSSLLTARMCHLVNLRDEARSFYRLALDTGKLSPEESQEAENY